MSLEPIGKILDIMYHLGVVKIELVTGDNTVGIQTTDSNGEVLQHLVSSILVAEGKKPDQQIEPPKKEWVKEEQLQEKQDDKN